MAMLIVMPKQGNTVESCMLTKWLRREGDAVKAGEPLFAYETDKSAFEENAPIDGILMKVLRDEGDDVPVMEGVCVIGAVGEDISALIQVAKPAEPKAAKPQAVTVDSPVPTDIREDNAAAVAGGFKASPRAKHLAGRMGLNASEALPTGPNGRVIARDIYALAGGRKRPAGQALAGGDYEDVPLSNIRKRIADSMHKSLAEMAQLTHHSSADATAMMACRAKVKALAATGGVNVTLNDMVLFAVSRVLKHHPDLNAHFLGDKTRYFHSINLGVAVDTERGLMVPTIFGADRMTLEEISVQSKKLSELCRSGAVNPDILSGGTFTVSNLGVLGVEMFTPVINPPQTAILGVCAIIDRPRKATSGFGIELYPALGLSLTYDHRAVDGAPASRFLQELCRALSEFDSFLADNREVS